MYYDGHQDDMMIYKYAVGGDRGGCAGLLQVLLLQNIRA